MNRFQMLFIPALALFFAMYHIPAFSRERQCIDIGWKFIHSDSLKAEDPGYEDGEWRTVNLPHDWGIEYPVDKEAATGGSGGYAETGVGWYRKRVSFDRDTEAGTVWLEFDGVYMNSDVWLNGHYLGNHPYGYTSFFYDVSEFLKKGENVIAVKVDNSLQPNSRWYSGSGIYRHVWLTEIEPVHIGHWGTVITASVDSDNGRKQFPAFTKIHTGHNNTGSRGIRYGRP